MKDLKRTKQEFDVKQVVFHNVEVREYPQILGDNPGVSEGEDKQSLCIIVFSAKLVGFLFVFLLSATPPHIDLPLAILFIQFQAYH